MIKGAVRSIVWMVAIVVVWAASVVWFAFHVSSYSLEKETKADAIIVLTGGGGRVEYGLELLAGGRGKALFISGVSKQVPIGALIAKAPMGVREMLGVASLGRITLGRDATNTIGNAEESVAWVAKRKYKTLLLVTADYHMPRALVEFSAQMPTGVTLIPAAVATRDYRDLRWLESADTRNLILAEFHKLAAAKLRHLFLNHQPPTTNHQP